MDGLGGPPIREAALAVRGDLIVDVGPYDEVSARNGTSRTDLSIDLGGGWVIPGLIDSHVHLATGPNRDRAVRELGRLLNGGITAVRDMAGDARTLATLARDVSTGAIEGPDLHFSALMAGPDFFRDRRPRASARGASPGDVPWMQAVLPGQDLVVAVALARGTSASGIKVYADLDAESVAGITSEAHRQGIPVWAHSMVSPARPLEVVRAGVDVMSHVCRLAWEGMAEAPSGFFDGGEPDYEAIGVDAAVFGELFDEMKERGTILDATLAMYEQGRRDIPEGPGAVERCQPDFARALVRRAHRDGVTIVAGSDFTAPDGDPYPALHQELTALVDGAGFTPMEAIVAATRDASRVLGREDEVGTLQPGMRATFVVLDADPTDDIANLRTVREVWKNARRFQRGDTPR